jgi:phosphate/sulfate permease
MFGTGIVGLSTVLQVLCVISLIFVFAFEFINGFHDTANAVATVIYTKTLKPRTAVIWSGICNFFGVLISSYFGLKVATNIASLIPADALISSSTAEGAAMVLAVLVAAMIWNLGTWYFGIPCSSSHTLIGSLLGVGLVYSRLPGNLNKVGVNWDEAAKIFKALLFSPFFGFSMAILLMLALRSLMKDKQIFKEPAPDAEPPTWIKAILTATCTLVSFFHGFNDGQKGVGLTLIILMTFSPAQFALHPDFDRTKANTALTVIENNLKTKEMEGNFAANEITKSIETITLLKQDIDKADNGTKSKLAIRNRLRILDKNMKVLLESPNVINNPKAISEIKSSVKTLVGYTIFAPFWAIMLTSIGLGLGTMIGWKRIVVTIGEKIGKRHMTYAEGATAELIAASTIGLASWFGAPVSTTHVLSSGVAGSMVASKGVKNLQKGTIGNILLAWLLTLPVTILLSGGLFLLFRMFV